VLPQAETMTDSQMGMTVLDEGDTILPRWSCLVWERGCVAWPLRMKP